MSKYWESETPLAITTSKNEIRYYPEAEKLSVARPPWTDEAGALKQGKTVTLDIAALLESDRSTLSAAQVVFTAITTAVDDRIAIL